MDVAAASVSVATLPFGAVAAVKRLLQASALTRVGTTRKQVGQRRKIGNCRRLAAVERVLDSAPPAARLNINEVGYVACGNTQTECLSP